MMKKKILSAAVCAALLLSAYAPTVSFADTNAEYAQLAETSGSTGEGLRWTLGNGLTSTFSDDGELVISGSGDMTRTLQDSTVIKKVTIEDGVTSICANAFSGCGALESVSIADSVTSIGENAFLRCRSLKSVKLPSGLDAIPNGMFSGCVELENAELPETVRRIGYSAFTNCFGISSMELPSLTESIGDSAFEGCAGLASITLPDALTSIGNRAFNGCVKLTEINIPKNVTSIGEDAFGSATALERIEADAGNEAYASDNGVLFDKEKILLIKYPANAGAAEYTVPDSVGIIEKNAFADCANLISVSIPESVYEVGQSAFSNCRALTAINVSEGNSQLMSDNGVLFTERGERLTAYPAGKADESYTVPDDTVIIGEFAFKGNEHLKSVNIPSGVADIEDGAFMDCAALKEAKVQALIAAVNPMVFYNCASLESIYLPGRLKIVSNHAFGQCAALANIFFDGTEENWNKVLIESKELSTSNFFFANAKVHFTGYAPITVTTIRTDKAETDEAWNFSIELGKYYEICYVTAASYKKDGTLIATNRSGLKEDRTAEVSIPKTDDMYSIKLFAWDGNMQPVTNSELVIVADDLTPELDSGYSVDTSWAVFNGSSVSDGITYADVLINGFTNRYPVADAGIMEGLSNGGIFFFTQDEEHRIAEIMPVTNPAALPDTYRGFFEKWLSEGEAGIINAETAAQFADDNSEVFKRTGKGRKCRIIAGPIVNTENMTQTVNGVKTNGLSLYIASGEEIAKQSMTAFAVENVRDIELAHDARVYRYDYSVTRMGSRLYPDTKSSVRKSAFSRSAYVGNKSENVINFEAELSAEKEMSSSENFGYVNFAVAKVVDNEITEILLITPSDEG